MSSKPTIAIGDWVLLTLPSKSTKIIDVRENGIVNLGKFGQFRADSIVGYAYGQSFEIQDDRSVLPLKSVNYGLEEMASESREDTPFESSKDNKQIVDKGINAQKLTSDEIEKMKREGYGNEVANRIIEKMIEGHDDFDKKTIYSQDKYLARKQRKFSRRFTVEYLTASNLLHYLHNDREPGRAMEMSEETLGLIMSHANVMPGGTYLVMDETGGVIVYDMLERMQGKGTIVLLHENDQPRLAWLHRTNYTEEQIDEVVYPLNLLEFTEPEENRPTQGALPEEEIKDWPEKRLARYHRRLRRAERTNHAIDLVESNSFDGLIYASTLNPTTFVPRIISKIKPSRPLVVYSEYKEMLLELTYLLLKDGRVLLPNVHESRVRHFQTIPGRIHPNMTSRSGGGYMMSGITVIPTEGAVALGLRGKKRKLEEGEDAESEKKEEDLVASASA